MSGFAGAESFVISLGASIQGVQDTFKAAITSYGWQCIHEAIPPMTILGTITNPSYALNLNYTQTAGDSAALPRWVGVRMASAFTPTIMYLSAGDNVVGAQSWNAPKTFTLDYSDDGTTWTTLQTWTNELAWLNGERRKYAVTGAAAHAYWRLNITAKDTGSYCYVMQWMLENAAGQVIANQNYIDLIPPSDQTIGDSVSREAVRMMFNASTITMQPIQELLTGYGQQIIYANGIAGAVTLSVTLNGATVSYIGSAGATATDNLRGLYDAIRASANANFTDWKWTWIGSIHSMRTTIASNIVPTVANCTIFYTGGSSFPQMQSSGIAIPENVSTDLVNGFVYYLQVNKRGLALATKTNVNFYGPMHACYGDNATAVAQVPLTDYGPNCTVMELVVGTDDISTNTGASGRFSHYWADGSSSIYTAAVCDSSSGYAANGWTHQMLGYLLADWSNSFSGGLGDRWIVLRGEGLFTGADGGVAWPVHRMSCDPDVSLPNFQGGSYTIRAVGPVFSGMDWYRYVGTLNNEQMVLAPHTDFETHLVGTLLASDTSIPVTNTTGFPAAGWISIMGEIIQYTSKDATHFLGCTRGKYSTVPYKNYDGTLVSIVGWYVKINTGLIFWGYQKPS